MKLFQIHHFDKKIAQYNFLFIFLLLNFNNAIAQDLTKLSYAEIDKIANTFASTGDYAASIPYMEVARNKAKAEFGELDSIYVKYTSDLGYFYHESGDYKKAEPLYIEIIALWAKVLGKEHYSVAESYGNLAMLYQEIGQYDKAEPFFLKSKDMLAKSFGVEHSVYGQIISNLALFYQETGQYEKAEPLYLQAKDIWLKTYGEQHPLFATGLNNLAGLYQKMGSYDKAEPLFLQAKNIRAATIGEEHPSFAISLNNLALLYKDIGLYEKAEPFFLQSQNIWAKVLGKEHPRYALSLNNLAILYQTTKNYSKAEKLFLDAKTITAKTQGTQHPDFASRLSNLGMLYKDMKIYEKAEPLFLQAIDIQYFVFGKEHPIYSSNLNNLAGLYLVMGKLDSAFSYCIKSIDANSPNVNGDFTDWDTLDEINYYSNIYSNASMAMLLEIFHARYTNTKDKKQLETYYQIAKAAMRFNERIRNGFSSDGDKLRTLDNNSFFVLQGISAGVELAKEGYAQEAFDFAELNRGVLLMDAAKTANAYKFGDLPDSLLIQEKKLQKEQSVLKAALLENLSKEQEDSLSAVLNKVKLDIDAFTKKLKTQYPKYAAIKYEDKTAKATEIQALLDDKTALLEYVISDNAIYIFYIDKQKVQLTRQSLNNKILSAKIKDFHTTLSDYKLLATDPKIAYNQYTENAYWFYENLVAPALIKGKATQNINKLIIVSDGELGHLPFETFLTKPAPQKETNYNELSYLINDYKISYNYSATLWKENKSKKHHSNNGEIFAMSANYDMKLDSNKLDWRLPTYQRLRNGLSPLPAAKKEVEILSETFSGFFGFDKEASEKKFKENASDYAVIHLAMHGLLDSKNPILSSLAFTEDGDSVENNFLQAYEISKMNLNVDLVVLSACETGYGRFDKGNGIASLAQAFAYAGAPAMIVSLWQVNDYATSEIMKNLYQNLADGMEKDEALQQAKLDYIKRAQGITAHPAFWSPFIQMGNTDAIYLKTKGGSFWWIVGGVMLALVGGVVVMRRKRKA